MSKKAADMDFPSNEFFDRLRTQLLGATHQFAKLGVFDATFAIRVQAGPGFPEERIYVFRFEVDPCTELTETDLEGLEDRVDFVLEAPYAVWCEMLASRQPNGEIDAAHTINTLCHFEDPMRVTYRDPIGHDKLFRFQQSVQLVFNVAAAVAAES